MERYNTRSSSKRSRERERITIVSKIREKVIDLSTIGQVYKKKMKKKKHVDENYDSDTVADPCSVDGGNNIDLLNT